MKVASQLLNVLAQFLTHYQHFCKKKKNAAPKSEEGGDEKQLCFFMRPYVEFKMSVLISPSKSLISSRWVTYITKNFLKNMSICDVGDNWALQGIEPGPTDIMPLSHSKLVNKKCIIWRGGGKKKKYNLLQAKKELSNASHNVLPILYMDCKLEVTIYTC